VYHISLFLRCIQARYTLNVIPSVTVWSFSFFSLSLGVLDGLHMLKPISWHCFTTYRCINNSSFGSMQLFTMSVNIQSSKNSHRLNCRMSLRIMSVELHLSENGMHSYLFLPPGMTEKQMWKYACYIWFCVGGYFCQNYSKIAEPIL